MIDEMPRWSARQADFANLFNPAFVAWTLCNVCIGYDDQQGMPFPLAFIAGPLSLSPDVRQNRPRSIAKKVPKWFSDRPAFRAEFATMAHSLVPAVREGIAFGLLHEVIETDGASLRGVSAKLLPIADAANVDDNVNISNYLQHATFVGRWLAASGGVASIFEAAGVRP